MDRSQKEALVQDLKTALEQATCVVVTKQVGLTVGEVTALRRSVRQAGAGYRVVKNNLARLAFAGTVFEALDPYLVGPTAITISLDPVAAAKAVSKFSETNDKLTVVGGMLSGNILDASAVNALAKLPSLDELRARLVGTILAPAAKIARLLVEPGSRIARVLAARS